ncbi:hypothetical protein M422DRAFT_257107 [Sphaerobolus stellatus SS14]|uniref:Unplaced genomic scaffold SPHSTscaffold_72, whole genome shotgun sequence n=1 Tax=Sphaerobolus stellatus (strain SS14) TaxID=990650 RepID=A0A0C9UYT0_SPHS4|nr:hypothetical protein M422DRAFT_257107 [Sphaerobolus stellatus SS14]
MSKAKATKDSDDILNTNADSTAGNVPATSTLFRYIASVGVGDPPTTYNLIVDTQVRFFQYMGWGCYGMCQDPYLIQTGDTVIHQKSTQKALPLKPVRDELSACFQGLRVLPA